MIKKLGLLTAICLLGLHSMPVYGQAMTAEEKYNPNYQRQPVAAARPRVKMPKSIVVCRAKQCAPTHLSMAKEYVFNTLLHMFDSNARQKVLVCQGNANTHACTEEFVRVPVTVGVTPADLYIDDVKIADVSISQRNTMALNLLLNWGVSYNGQTPVCRPAKNLLYVKNVSNVIMEDNGYTCKMTTVGNTTVSTMFAIDYIDLDYGYIGGYYSIGLSGPAFGGGSGYMILRLPNDITVEAKDFEVKPLDPKIEESVEEVIEELPLEIPQEATEEEQPKEEVKAEPVHLTAPVLPEGYPTQGQYLYDSNSGQYIPLKALTDAAKTQNSAAPAVQQPSPVVGQAQQKPQYDMTVEPFQYAATSRRSYGISDTMPTDEELMEYVDAPQMQTPVPLMPANQTIMPQNMAPMYYYDAARGQYIPVMPMPLNQISQNAGVPVQAEAREPQAPNVNTIIKYNHPAYEYEKAKAEAAAEAERQRKVEKKKKEIEAQAVDFAGVKVFPIPSSNEDRTTVAPTLKNSLSEYNKSENKKTESRRFE